MVDSALFQITIAVAALGFVILFADSVDTDNPDSLKVKLLGAMIFYTLEMFTLLLPATTRETYHFFGLQIPPIQIWWESLTLGFLVSATWDVYFKQGS